MLYCSRLIKYIGGSGDLCTFYRTPYRIPHSGQTLSPEPCSPYHLGAGGIPLVFPPSLAIKAIEYNKLGDVKAGELLSGPLGFYAVNNHEM